MSDWRSLPRKPDHLRRTLRLDIRVSPVELQRIKERAAAAGLKVSEYVIRRALGAKRRPS